MSREEAHFWRERYQTLFERNIAGVILTSAAGQIIDCNEPCARIFGFDSRDEMLNHTAWDFYFHREERERLLDELHTQRDCPMEEVCMRHRSGRPVWILATRTVVSFAEGRPDLLQGTLIDITVQRKARAPWEHLNHESPASRREGDAEKMTDLAQTLATLLLHASEILHPNNLPRIGKSEIQDFVLTFEQMKMSMSDLEILNLFHE
jgi:PAS domain S-box-containing protein